MLLDGSSMSGPSPRGRLTPAQYTGPARRRERRGLLLLPSPSGERGRKRWPGRAATGDPAWPPRPRTPSGQKPVPERPGVRLAVHVPAVQHDPPLPAAAPRPPPVRQRPAPRPRRLAAADERPLAAVPDGQE